MIALLTVFSLTTAVPALREEARNHEFRAQVDAAREKAVKYLLKQQDKDGGWESMQFGTLTTFKGGSTALVALGLLEAGMPADNAAVAKAVEFLLALKPNKPYTYVVSLQTQVLARVDAKKYAEQIQKNADWLIVTSVVQGEKLRGWGYPDALGGMVDGSNTHFAVTALHAAAQAGAKVDAGVWRKIRDCYAEGQHESGGWGYGRGTPEVSTSMTVGGLTSLAVAVKYDKQAKGPDPAFEKGMATLLSNKHKLGNGKSAAVAWMNIAELGRALDVVEFKSGKLAKSWYREGAEKMLKAQQLDGSFRFDDSAGGAVGIDNQPVLATACALYFFGPPAKK